MTTIGLAASGQRSGWIERSGGGGANSSKHVHRIPADVQATSTRAPYIYSTDKNTTGAAITIRAVDVQIYVDVPSNLRKTMRLRRKALSNI